jgi:hypothetical protein
MSCLLKLFWIKDQNVNYDNSNQITFTECVRRIITIYYYQRRSLFDGESVNKKTPTWFTTIFYPLLFRYIEILVFLRKKKLFDVIERKIRRLAKSFKREDVHLFSDRDGRLYVTLTSLLLYTRVCTPLSSVATNIHLFVSTWWVTHIFSWR